MFKIDYFIIKKKTRAADYTNTHASTAVFYNSENSDFINCSLNTNTETYGRIGQFCNIKKNDFSGHIIIYNYLSSSCPIHRVDVDFKRSKEVELRIVAKTVYCAGYLHDKYSDETNIMKTYSFDCNKSDKNKILSEVAFIFSQIKWRNQKENTIFCDGATKLIEEKITDFF